MKLTFYLFNESVTEFDQAIVPAKLSGADPFYELMITADLPFEAKAYFQKNRLTKPKWLSFLEPYCEIPEEVANATSSFLLLIRTQGRLLAVTAGFGFTALDRSRLERGFGLRVTLNEIDPKRIKTVDARKIDTSTKQKRVLINRDSALYDFDFDLDEDLLNVISGQPRDDALARKLVGSDSLSITAEMCFLDLGQKCDALLQSFLKDDYKKAFAFIDHLQMVRDPQLESQLDGKLVDAMAERRSAKLMLAYPEVVDWEHVERFKFIYEHRTAFADEVDLGAVYEFFDQQQSSSIDPRRVYIIGLDHEDRAVTRKSSLYEYAVFELTHNEKRYLLSLGRWFRLADDYVRQVDAEMQRIEEIDEAGYLPVMQKRQREDDYNRNVADADSSFVCLDKRNFMVEGQSKVEVCDLLSRRAEFVCVKKYNDSSTLSHLFDQGVVSATLLNDSREYRKYVLGFCRPEWGAVFDLEQPDRQKITFVFAIASDAAERLANSLPFFSKVTLRQARKSIERMGFKVRVYRIPYC